VGRCALAVLAIGVLALLLPLPAAATNNHDPVAVAPADRVLPVLESFELNGSASSDPDGDPIRCNWGWSGQPPGHFADPNSCNTTFTPESSGIFRFRLTVWDPAGAYNLSQNNFWVGQTGLGIAMAVTNVSVANHAPRIVSAQPPPGDVYGEEEQHESEHSQHYTTASNIVLAVTADDPDAGNLTVEWYVDGAEPLIPERGWSDDLDGHSSFVLHRMAGTYDVVAVASDGASNESARWIVHVATPGMSGVAIAFGNPFALGSIVAAVAAIGVAWALWRRKQA